MGQHERTGWRGKCLRNQPRQGQSADHQRVADRAEQGQGHRPPRNRIDPVAAAVEHQPDPGAGQAEGDQHQAEGDQPQGGRQGPQRDRWLEAQQIVCGGSSTRSRAAAKRVSGQRILCASTIKS